MASINEEIGEVVRLLRTQWLTPVHPGWGWWRRFLHTFAGSFTTLAVVVNARVPADFKIVAFDSEARNLGIFLVPVVLFLSGWFAWLTSFKDQGYGPVRLYLSGLALPALTWWIVSVTFNIN